MNPDPSLSGELEAALTMRWPASVAEAEAMEKVGHAYLKQHAPERLTPVGLERPVAIRIATPAQPLPDDGVGESLAEMIAQFLHDEVDLPDKFIGYHWPLHDADDGYRGDGAYVKLQPKDIVEHYRDAGKRLAARLALLPAAQPVPAPPGETA